MLGLRVKAVKGVRALEFVALRGVPLSLNGLELSARGGLEF